MLQLRRNTASLVRQHWQLRKLVSTWSPLATAFNAPPAKRLNFTRDDVVSWEKK